MTTKLEAKDCIIKEAIIEDLASNLTIQISKYDDEKGGCRISIFKLNPNKDILPYGNRDIVFDENGEDAGGGTNVSGRVPKPTWIKEIDKPTEQPDES